ncbi:MAG: aldo/keto reductase [Clostridia bacterium]|nr:aldo/keto reductase [Clostridia bacterium]
MIRNIPGTKLYTSSLVLGTDILSPTVGDADMQKILDRYVDLGGTHIDTAALYGHGHSEEVIADWFKKSGKRNEVLIATKGGFPNPETMHISRLSKAELTSDLESSLSRLGINEVDLYWLHRDDEALPVEPIIDTLNTFVKQGKIRYFGASNWKAERIKKANAYAKSSGQQGFCASQIKYAFAPSAPSFEDDPTLVEMNTAEHKFYAEESFPVVCFASQSKGYFQKLAAGLPLSPKAEQRYDCPENRTRFENLLKLSNETGYSATQLLLAYLTSESFMCLPIVGANSVEKLTDSMSAAEIVLTQAQREMLIQGTPRFYK